MKEPLRFFPRWTVEKWDLPAGAQIDPGDSRRIILPDGKIDYSPEYRRLLGLPPDNVLKIEGNIALNAGIGVLLDLLGGIGTPAAFSNANSRLYVGNGTAAAVATQTDLQGASKAEKAMDSGFPVRSGTTITWKATFGTAEANFAWEEGGVKNAAGTPNGTTIILFNRKVQSLGTKASGSNWTLALDVTVA